MSVYDFNIKVKEFIAQLRAGLKFFDELQVMICAEAPGEDYEDNLGVFLYVEDPISKRQNEEMKLAYEAELKMYNDYIDVYRKAEKAAKEVAHLNGLRLQKAQLEREIIEAEKKSNKGRK